MFDVHADSGNKWAGRQNQESAEHNVQITFFNDCALEHPYEHINKHELSEVSENLCRKHPMWTVKRLTLHGIHLNWTHTSTSDRKVCVERAVHFLGNAWMGGTMKSSVFIG